MKVHIPTLWNHAPSVDYSADSIELARIVPRSGARRRVYLSKSEDIADGQKITCIWSPPASEVNGWTEQPSEIALSYVVTGIAHLAPSAPGYEDIGEVDYFRYVAGTYLGVDIDVHHVRPLIETLTLSAPDSMFRLPTLGTISGKSIPLWLDSEGVSCAKVAGYIYLFTTSCETLLQALVRKTEKTIILGFHEYSPPHTCESFILNNPLSLQDQELFEHLISVAEPIEDMFKPYLIQA